MVGQGLDLTGWIKSNSLLNVGFGHIITGSRDQKLLTGQVTDPKGQVTDQLGDGSALLTSLVDCREALATMIVRKTRKELMKVGD